MDGCMTIEHALSRFEERKKSYLADLETLVRIPSVSFPGFDPKQVRASAEALVPVAARHAGHLCAS